MNRKATYLLTEYAQKYGATLTRTASAGIVATFHQKKAGERLKAFENFFTVAQKITTARAGVYADGLAVFLDD